jgi:thiamine monophosphate kinase
MAPRRSSRAGAPDAALRRGPDAPRIATSAIDVSTASSAIRRDLRGERRRRGDRGERRAGARGQAELAASIAEDGLGLALSGGEDYELVFTSADHARASEIAIRIGTIAAGDRTVVEDAAGTPIDLEQRGHRHR